MCNPILTCGKVDKILSLYPTKQIREIQIIERRLKYKTLSQTKF